MFNVCKEPFDVLYMNEDEIVTIQFDYEMNRGDILRFINNRINK